MTNKVGIISIKFKPSYSGVIAAADISVQNFFTKNAAKDFASADQWLRRQGCTIIEVGQSCRDFVLSSNEYGWRRDKDDQLYMVKLDENIGA